MVSATTLKATDISIKEAQEAINSIEDGLANSDSIIKKMFTEKKHVVRYLADCYEILIVNRKMEGNINEIATYLMKKIKSLDADISKIWVYESLPAKYKSHRLNADELSEFTQNSSIYTKNYEVENAMEIDFINSYVMLLKQRITALKKEPYCRAIDAEQYREDYIIRGAALKLLQDTWDNRKTVPVNTIHLLLDAFDRLNLKRAAGEYISLLKKFGAEKKEGAMKDMKKIFTPKQVGKILKGLTRELHMSQEIHNSKDAYENGFFGKACCEDCGNWRVIIQSHYNPKTDSFDDPELYCFACGHTGDIPPTKLPLSSPTPRRTDETN